MRFYFLIILLTVLFISSFGCSHDSGNPATPDEEREIQTFDFGSNEIFGPNTNGDFAANFHDIDLCQIARVQEDPGREWHVDHGCAAVTLWRPQDANPIGVFKPVFRWLDSSVPDEGGPIMFVTAFDQNN